MVQNRLIRNVNRSQSLAIARIYNTEPGDLVPQDAVS